MGAGDGRGLGGQRVELETSSSQLDTTSGGDGGTGDPGSHLITYLDRVHNSSGLSDGICLRNNQVNKNPLQGRTLQLESRL
jgi:hypothetical protein